MTEDMDSVERRGCMITDHYNRNIDYIRISITDRCNLRCRYCMPEDISFVGHDKIYVTRKLHGLCGFWRSGGLQR